MERNFTPYEIALALKELGFDEPCFASYVKESKEFTTRGFADFYKEQQIYAPLYQQAFRWFRENYGYDVSIVRRTVKAYKFEIQKLVYEGNDYFFNDFSFDSHEEAELECLKKLIEIVKQ